jgi:dCMP deaminase
MKTAWNFSELSTAVRLKVGCVIVKDDTIIGIGYNGMPSKWSNVCEYKVYAAIEQDEEKEYPYVEEDQRYRLVTRPEVLHAESNAIAKIARSTMSSVGSTLFITHAPCIECAKIIYQAQIEKVYFDKEYRSNDGLDFLSKSYVKVIKYDSKL